MMDALGSWFQPLDTALAGSEAAGRDIGPDAEEAKLLLEIGKTVAERGPQRYYAMLTAFAIGRALGRAESQRPGTSGPEFLRWAAAKIDEAAADKGGLAGKQGYSNPEG